MLALDPDGMCVLSKIKKIRKFMIERGPIGQIKGIIVHQTAAPTARSTLNSYDHYKPNGAHFLIDRDGSIMQTASLKQRTNHVGKLKVRCIWERRCGPRPNLPPSALDQLEKVKKTTDRSGVGKVVRIKSLVGLVILISVSQHCEARCSEPTETDPSFCDFKMPKIERIVITQNGLSTSSNPGIDCSDFRLTVEQVRRYLSHVRQIAPETSEHDLYWSPCSVIGTMTLADGRVVDWNISKINLARLEGKGFPSQRLECIRCDKGKPYRLPDKYRIVDCPPVNPAAPSCRDPAKPR